MYRMIAMAVLMSLPLGGCLAAKIVTVPVGLAGDALEAAASGVILIGGTAVRVTGDALDGPDEMVRLDVIYRKGSGTRTETRKVKARHVERELRQISKKGPIIDARVSPLD